MALSDGLAGYWSAWQGSSGYRLLDRARSNHGTLTNMDAGTDWVGATVQGRSGYALDFDGNNDYVAIARKAADFGLLSISFWFFPRPTSAQVQRGLLQWADALSSSSPFILFTQQDPGTLHRVYVDGNYRVTINTVANTWNMLTIVQEPGFLWRVYLNGISQGTYQDDSTTNFKSSATRIDIGNGFAAHFNGQFADLGLWSRALTNSEVQQLYNQGPGWYQPYKKRGYGYAAAVAGFKPYWHRRETQLIGGGLR